jgi:hypothetical protein
LEDGELGERTRISYRRALPLRAGQLFWTKLIFMREPELDNKSDEEMIAQYKKRSEQTMKIVVTVLAVGILCTLYILWRQ